MEYRLELFNSDSIESLLGHLNSEILSIVNRASIDLDESHRRELSTQFRTYFQQKGWNQHTTLYFEDARKNTPHFIKNGILVHVSWRHYEKIGTELMKLQIDYVRKKISAAVIICITNDFLNVFKKHYKLKGQDSPFSGSITLERVKRYIAEVSSMLSVPIVIIGLLPPPINDASL
ncbi:MAG: BglII/BstYI family type II restriction endonuclease [Candidatus Thorarchaeota archaeon]